MDQELFRASDNVSFERRDILSRIENTISSILKKEKL